MNQSHYAVKRNSSKEHTIASNTESPSPFKLDKSNISRITQILSKMQDSQMNRSTFERKKYEQLLAKISYVDVEKPPEERRYNYNYEGMLPYVFFYKYLAKKPDETINNCSSSNYTRLKLWLPDTIVLNEKNDLPLMWFYTSEDGYVYRTDSFSLKNVVTKLSNYASPDELVAVIKKPSFRVTDLVGNDVKLLSSKELSISLLNAFSNRQETNVLQKFIKSNGPKAYICRTCWRKDKSPYSWVITNKLDFYTDNKNIPESQKFLSNPNHMNSCTIVYTSRGKQVQETAPYLRNIDKYLNLHLGIQFEEIIGDFIRDESGIWWLINIKGFVLIGDPLVDCKPITNYGEENVLGVNEIKKQELKKEEYKKVKICRYCEIVYPVVELTHKMTLKMIIELDQHLMSRGKKFEWLSRYDKQIDSVTLYEEHKICKSCFKLFKEIEKLTELQMQFCKSLGIQISDEFKDYPLNASNPIINPSNANSKKKLSLEKMIISNKESNPLKKTLIRYRLMIYLQTLNELPADLDIKKNYFIEYNIFDQKLKYKLDMSNIQRKGKMLYLPINKVKVFYFFANDRRAVSEFFFDEKAINFRLFIEQKKVGTTDLELNDFLSETSIKREYFKYFSGKELTQLLSWGLSIILGLSEGPNQFSETLDLTEHKKIYLPSQDFYAYEPLPYEWMSSIVEKRDDLNGSIISKTEKPQFILNSFPLNPSKKLTSFSINNEKRSKSTLRRDNSMNDMSASKISKFSKINSSEKLNKIMVDDANDNEIEWNEKTFENLLKDEIFSYEKKDLARKIKQKSRAKKMSTFHQFSYGISIA